MERKLSIIGVVLCLLGIGICFLIPAGCGSGGGGTGGTGGGGGGTAPIPTPSPTVSPSPSPTLTGPVNHCYGGFYDETGYSVRQTSDGGYITAGSTTSNDGDVSGFHDLVDAWVFKTDASGNLQWQKCLGGSMYDRFDSVRQTSDGGYIVAGRTSSNDGDVSGNHGEMDFWVVKLDTAGDILWQKCLGGSLAESAYSITQNSDGGYIVTGSTSSNDGDVSGNTGSSDLWVVCLDSSGNIEWQKCMGGMKGDRGYSVRQTSDTGYILGGTTWSVETPGLGNGDFWAVKIDSVGNVEWQKVMGGRAEDKAHSIWQTIEGDYIMAGTTSSNSGDVSGNHGDKDFWVVKLDTAGDILWQKCLGGSAEDIAYSVLENPDGTYVVAGHTSSNDGNASGNHGQSDFWVVKLNNTGVFLWQNCHGGSHWDAAYSIDQTSGGGYILTGGVISQDGDIKNHHGGMDIWVVEIDSTGSLP